MSVYFIKPIDYEGPIKIGHSKDVRGRFVGIQEWCPFPLEILATIEGGEEVERRFHARFADSHKRQEWFDTTPELLETIEAIKAGTFDVETLPPRSMVCKPVYVASEKTKRQLSYSLRCVHMADRTGFSCRYDVQNALECERPDVLDAYLDAPHVHGYAINSPWAREKQQAWLEKQSVEA